MSSYIAGFFGGALATLGCMSAIVFLAYCYLQFWDALQKNGIINQEDWQRPYAHISRWQAWRRLPDGDRTFIVRVGAFGPVLVPFLLIVMLVAMTYAYGSLIVPIIPPIIPQ